MTETDLTAAERELLLKLNGLDQGPRGCFAKRETLARMLECSVSRINHAVSDLKMRGYITVETEGRRRDEAAIIRVTLAGRMTAKGLQAVCKESSLYKEEYMSFWKYRNNSGGRACTL